MSNKPAKQGLRLNLLADLRDQHWIDNANCATTDPEIFHPKKGGSTTPARMVCLRCEVREPCLHYALTSSVPLTGVWGGKSDRQRQQMRRQLRSA